jgi:hypothetical protein
MVKNYSVIKSFKLKQESPQDNQYCARDINGVLAISGKDFIPLTHENKNLMTMFKPGSGKTRFPSPVVACIRDARNQKVNKLLINHLQADPMAERVELPGDTSARIKLFHAAKVPGVIKINMDQHMTDNGEIIHACELDVTSHPKLAGPVYVALSDASMTWIGQMCSRSYPDTGDEEAAEKADILELVESWLPEGVSIIPNVQKGPHAMPYWLRVRRHGKLTNRAVAIQGLASHELKEYIDEQILELMKKADGKGSDSSPSDKSSASSAWVLPGLGDKS